MEILKKATKVLVLAPHTDDGELGVGGTIARFIEEGKEVYYAAFSTAEESVPEGYEKDILTKEVRNATKVLGIKEENLLIFGHRVRKLNYVRQEILENMVEMRRTINPDIIFMPSLNDIHQDHHTIAEEALRAFKNKIILGYELIWNNLTFNTQCFVFLEDRHIDKKIDSLKMYTSQQGRNYFSEEFIRSLAIARGVQIGCRYAEAFEVVRFII